MLRNVLSEKQNIKLNDFGFSLKIKEQLLNSVSNKLNPNNSEEIKYHKKCIMLTGLPNTGKTTLGMSILNEFQCETFIIKTQRLINYSLEFDNNSGKHYSPEILKELFQTTRVL